MSRKIELNAVVEIGSDKGMLDCFGVSEDMFQDFMRFLIAYIIEKGLSTKASDIFAIVISRVPSPKKEKIILALASMQAKDLVEEFFNEVRSGMTELEN